MWGRKGEEEGGMMGLLRKRRRRKRKAALVCLRVRFPLFHATARRGREGRREKEFPCYMLEGDESDKEIREEARKKEEKSKIFVTKQACLLLSSRKDAFPLEISPFLLLLQRALGRR